SIPLGYSLVGEVIAVGARVNDIKLGDRVACAGQGHASHAEVVSVPRNLCVVVPDSVPDDQAAYVTLGAIAMHGVRQADQQFGATVLVVGLGLVGLITLQLCVAAGYRVVGVDPDPRKTDLAKALGAVVACSPADAALRGNVLDVTRGRGVDAALITAAARESGETFALAAELCRDRARVVVVGDVKMDIERRAYFQKELDIVQSRSYGPGRYDPAYEQDGQDYPVGYVRWTERRNMEAFIGLLADKRVDMARLTTHRYSIDKAAEAYDLVTGAPVETVIGVLLEYGPAEMAEAIPVAAPRKIEGRVGLGVIGAGAFARGVLLPALEATGGFGFVGVASGRGISAKSVAERYGAAYAAADGIKVIEDANVQAVVIATRHDSHARYVIEALRRGKHVLVEKPLCLTAAELDEIEKAAKSSSGVLMVGFNRRFSPLAAECKAHFDGLREPFAMVYRVNAGRIPTSGESAWVHDPAIGGGRIIGEACHFVDLMQAICESRPVTVTAQGLVTGRGDLAANDIVTMTVGFEDGSMGTIHYFANGDSGIPKERLEIFRQERVAVLDDFSRLDLVANGKTRTLNPGRQQKGIAEEAAAFLAACRTGVAPVALQSLLDTTLVTIAAEASLRGQGGTDEGGTDEG
ncbi:MAG: zinc-binding dehydrogenase, partial [Alphaproteobacteria bacterium]|nr:zinc-binding dehydrogenase [Alphaproteobacteria bacterium]